jgi:hypothetical protein
MTERIADSPPRTRARIPRSTVSRAWEFRQRAGSVSLAWENRRAFVFRCHPERAKRVEGSLLMHSSLGIATSIVRVPVVPSSSLSFSASLSSRSQPNGAPKLMKGPPTSPARGAWGIESSRVWEISSVGDKMGPPGRRRGRPRPRQGERGGLSQVEPGRFSALGGSVICIFLPFRATPAVIFSPHACSENKAEFEIRTLMAP